MEQDRRLPADVQNRMDKEYFFLTQPIPILKTRLRYLTSGFSKEEQEILENMVSFSQDEGYAGLTREYGSTSYYAEGKIPFVVHPLRVAIRILESERDVTLDEVAAAILHDVVEDNHHFTLNDIGNKFGSRIKDLVGQLTKKDDESDEIYIQNITDPTAIKIKFYDRIDNIIDLCILTQDMSISFNGRQIIRDKLSRKIQETNILLDKVTEGKAKEELEFTLYMAIKCLE